MSCCADPEPHWSHGDCPGVARQPQAPVPQAPVPQAPVPQAPVTPDRQPRSTERLVALSVRLPPAVADALAAEADRRMVGRNYLVTRALERFLADLPDPE